MTAWASVAAALLGVVAAILRYLSQRKGVDDAMARVMAKRLQEANDELDRANRIRHRVLSDSAYVEWVRSHGHRARQPDDPDPD